MPDRIGEVLAERYELLEVLGEGGFGKVYRAHDNKLRVDVAVKLLLPALTRHKRGLKSLIKEAVISMGLTHSNIVRLHNFEESKDDTFLVMEYVNGNSLYDLLQGKKFDEDEVSNIAIAVCTALAYAHSKGIVHRDIKPANIMLTKSDEIKIADFGIAKVLRSIQTRTSGSMTSGTLIYMSPEQIRGKVVDPRSDIYSLGITLFELLTGKAPFESGDITHCHLHEPMPQIDDVSDSIDPPPPTVPVVKLD